MGAVPVGSRLRAIVVTAVSAIDIQASSRSRLDFLERLGWFLWVLFFMGKFPEFDGSSLSNSVRTSVQAHRLIRSSYDQDCPISDFVVKL